MSDSKGTIREIGLKNWAIIESVTPDLLFWGVSARKVRFRGAGGFPFPEEAVRQGALGQYFWKAE
jgi:hypothetical protein